MQIEPLDILKQFPLRGSKQQKQAFLDAAADYLSMLGYSCTWETGSFDRQNLVIGPPETAKYLITAAWDASAVAALLEIARTFPEKQRHQVCFALLYSARAYRNAHKDATDRQLVLQLGGITGSNQLRMAPSKRLKEDRRKLTSFYKVCGYFGKKSLLTEEKPCRTPFPYAMHIYAVPQKKRIPQPPPLDMTNINILRAALTTYICRGAAQSERKK